MVTALACGIEDVAEMDRGTKDWYDRVVKGTPICQRPKRVAGAACVPVRGLLRLHRRDGADGDAEGDSI